MEIIYVVFIYGAIYACKNAIFAYLCCKKYEMRINLTKKRKKMRVFTLHFE